MDEIYHKVKPFSLNASEWAEIACSFSRHLLVYTGRVFTKVHLLVTVIKWIQSKSCIAKHI